MKLALMWAMSRNRTIGRHNALPWHLPEDLRYFKRVTMGKPIIMGRKTWDSIGRPLPGRTNIVISRDPHFTAEGVTCVPTLEKALSVARSQGVIDGSEEVVVIGGAQIYALALPQAERLYLTEIDADVEGDAFFPASDRSQWQELAREHHAASGPNPYDYSFVVLERKPA